MGVLDMCGSPWDYFMAWQITAPPMNLHVFSTILLSIISLGLLGWLLLWFAERKRSHF